MCDLLYGDVASGEDCVSPSMDLETFKEVRYENVEVEDVESDDDLDGNQDGIQVQNSEMEDFENEEPGFFKSLIDEVNLDDTTTPPNQSGIFKKNHKPTKSNTKPKTINITRRGRESEGSAMLKEHLGQSYGTQQCVIQYLKLETSNSKSK
ncbi:hypothetical protein Tco_0958772 [Tanacetum coccineum]